MRGVLRDGAPRATRMAPAVVAVKDASAVSEEDLISYCKGQMAAYKYPRSIEFLDEVPKTATGKFLRRELREGTRA